MFPPQTNHLCETTPLKGLGMVVLLCSAQMNCTKEEKTSVRHTFIFIIFTVVIYRSLILPMLGLAKVDKGPWTDDDVRTE